MNDLEFYKELYFYELERRKELNEAVNVPIGILTAIVGVHIFIYTQDIDKGFLFISMLVCSYITLIAVVISIFFLLVSFSNFFKPYGYHTLTGGKEYLDHLNKELKTKDETEVRKTFEKDLIKELANNSSENLKINIKRSEALANSKVGISTAVVFTAFFSLFFITSLIN